MMTDKNIDPALPHFEVRKFLATGVVGRDFDVEFADILRLPYAPYSRDLGVVVSALQNRSYWWHLSHIEAIVIPRAPAHGAEQFISNSQFYDREGTPIKYSCMVSESHALALCNAWVKAAFDLPAAYYVVASAIEEAWAREPPSREYMMAYYEARENMRQEAITAVLDGKDWTGKESS